MRAPKQRIAAAAAVLKCYSVSLSIALTLPLLGTTPIIGHAKQTIQWEIIIAAVYQAAVASSILNEMSSTLKKLSSHLHA